MKKIFLWALWLWFLFSFSYGAVLSLSPSEWKIPENCIQAFNVDLYMENWEETLAMDLIVKSNMEFVNFEKWSVFKYSVPSRTEGDTTYLVLFNGKGLEISEWGVVWKLYYNTTNVDDPYIEFVFNEVWDTRDTNVAIGGRDILTEVIPGKYTISQDIECENPVTVAVNLWETYDMDDFIKDYKADHRMENILFFLKRNKWYVLWIAWLLIMIIVLVSYKAQKKW